MTLMSVHASGQSMPVLVSPCQWSVHTSGLSMPVVSPCQWSVYASPCQSMTLMSVHASGQSMIVIVSPCQRSLRASGQGIPTASQVTVPLTHGIRMKERAARFQRAHWNNNQPRLVTFNLLIASVNSVAKR